MFQDILTWIIVGVCVAVAIGMIVRRLRGRKCGCGSSQKNCKPSIDACAGCAASDLCKNPGKK